MSGEGLIREEVLRHQSSRHLAGIRLSGGKFGSAAAMVSVALIGALIAFVGLGTFSKRVTITGRVVAAQGEVKLASPSQGVVADLMVREGDLVEAGEPLARIDLDRRSPDAGGRAQAGLGETVGANIAVRAQSIKADIRSRGLNQEAQQRSLRERRASLESDLSRLVDEESIALKKLALAQRAKARFADLASSGFMSEIGAQSKEEEFLDAEMRLKAAGRAVAAARRELRRVDDEMRELAERAKQEISALERSLATVQQEEAENAVRSKVVLTAPKRSRVAAIYAHDGVAVGPGQMVMLLHAHEGGVGRSPGVAVELYAPSKTIGFIDPGQTVWLRYSAFAYQKFGLAEARITEISRSAISPVDLPQSEGAAVASALSRNEPIYRIKAVLERQTVEVDGMPREVRPGLQVEATIAAERRRVWEWLLEPLLGMRKRMNI